MIKSARTFPVVNPRTGEPDYEIVAMDADAVAAEARRLRDAQPEWRARGIAAWTEAMRGLADALERHADSVSAALEIDTGRRRLARSEVQSVIGSMRSWAALAPTLINEPDWVQGRAKPNCKHQTELVPYQLIGVISPWNFPITLSFIDAIPAIIAGACALIKPGEVTPRFADALRPVIKEAIALTNDTAFGLSGAVFAGSIEEAQTVGQQIDAGAISLMDGALTGQYFEAPKQSFKASGLGGSRMGEDGFRRFFRQKAYIANTTCPLTMKDFSETAL